MSLRRALVLCSTMLMVVPCGVAQQACPTTMLVGAIDSQSKTFVEGLSATDFRAQIQHVPVELTVTGRHVHSFRAVLVLDGSGSMLFKAGAPLSPWGIAVDTAIELISAAPPDASFGILAFSGPRRLQIPVFSDRSKLTKSLENVRELNVGGDSKTPLWDAVDSALDMLGPPRSGDVVLLATDGGDNDSHTELHAVTAKALSGQTRVFAITFTPMFPQTQEEMVDFTAVANLVKETGGAAISLDQERTKHAGPDERLRRFRAIAASLNFLASNSYRLSFERPASTGLQKFKLEVPNRKVEVQYPHLLPPCNTHP